MATNFLETVKNYFTVAFSQQAATSLDESSAAISAALTAIIPTGLAAILRKATSGEEGANIVFNLSKDAASYLSPIPNLTDLHNEERGSDIPSIIFEKNESQVEKAISHYAGIRNSSTSALITLAMPEIMGLLGKQANENNLSPSGLAGFLFSQKDQISHAIPSPLSSVASMLGFEALGSAAPSVAAGINPKDTSNVIEKPKKKVNWLPLILILAVFALLIYFSRGCGQTKKTESPPTGQLLCNCQSSIVNC